MPSGGPLSAKLLREMCSLSARNADPVSPLSLSSQHHGLCSLGKSWQAASVTESFPVCLLCKWCSGLCCAVWPETSCPCGKSASNCFGVWKLFFFVMCFGVKLNVCVCLLRLHRAALNLCTLQRAALFLLKLAWATGMCCASHHHQLRV